MVAAAAAHAFFPVSSSFHASQNGASSAGLSGKTSMILGGGSDNLDTRGIKAKPTSSGGVQVKVNAQATPMINGRKVGVMESGKNVGLKDVPEADIPYPSPPSRTIINQLPDWSMLLAAITTIFLAAEKQWTNLDWKPRRPDMFVDAFGLGRIVQDGLVFRQNFAIRSYEIGADRTASIETLMNHLQETALNHVKSAGLMGDGFGSTPAMSRRDLIWVVTKMQILVDRYPSWGDIVEVDTWVGASGKNGMRRDWRVRDCATGQTVTRATSVWVMMNKRTRKLSKLPEEVREEIEPYFMGHTAILDEDSRKLPKLGDGTADYIRRGLTPRWNDLDINQHVNNVKYIGWILEEAYLTEKVRLLSCTGNYQGTKFMLPNERNSHFWPFSAPVSILESHKLSGMTLEYRRECGRDSVLQSLTAVSGDTSIVGGSPEAAVECTHLLRLESGAEVVRGRTEWKPKRVNYF